MYMLVPRPFFNSWIRRLQDILVLMFKVKTKLTVKQIADIFNINEENTNSKRNNLRNAILSYLDLKLLLMENIQISQIFQISDFSDHNCGQS